MKTLDQRKLRKAKDITRTSASYLFASVGVLFLVLIFAFVFRKGYKYLNPSFLFGDYYAESITASYSGETEVGTFEDPEIGNVYFSTRWGVGFEDSTDAEKNEVVAITYVDRDSPFNALVNKADNTVFSTSLDSSVSSFVLYDDDGNLFLLNTKGGAEQVASEMERANVLSQVILQTKGGGIRGSLISTLWMVLLTLLFALPLGILSAVYLSRIAKQNKVTDVLHSLIDLAGGIPTIIYGLVGAIIFIPLISTFTKKDTGSILSGSLTLAIMLLPVIIKTVEESLKTVPEAYRDGSLALGASETETIFHIILPNALPGIISAVLLAIGRIIGESAALIYSMGTAIKDRIFLSESSATLALHIYKLMEMETPNYDAACGVSLVIILFDLVLNLAVKLITNRFNKKFQR